jgi:hypothetical protein
VTEEPFGKNNIESFIKKPDAAFSDNQNPQKSEPKGENSAQKYFAYKQQGKCFVEFIFRN